MAEVTLEVKNLHKTIGRKEIIKGLNFELKKGGSIWLPRSKWSRKNNNDSNAHWPH